MKRKLSGSVLTATFVLTSMPVVGNDLEEHKPKVRSFIGAVARVNAGTIRDWCRCGSMESFDPKCLSNPLAEVVMDVTIAQNGTPAYKITKTVNCSQLDIFYCAQAIWEGAPALSEGWAKDFTGTNFTCDFKSVVEKDTCFRSWQHMFPQGKSRAVMHFVPLSIFRRCTALLGPNQIDGTANIVNVKDNLVNSELLQDFRLDWVSFINNRTTIPEEETRTKIAKMREKYNRTLFEDNDQKK